MLHYMNPEAFDLYEYLINALKRITSLEEELSIPQNKRLKLS